MATPPTPTHGTPPTELSAAEISRYSRHLLLKDVGVPGQRRLKASSVVCVGAGGLGSPLLMYLAAAGVGRIGIVDHDVVDGSNLQRQLLHGTSQVGVAKTRSAQERLAEINPHVQVETFEEALTSANALQILENFDVVVDGSDNFPTRYLVNDATVILGKPNVYGSIFKFEGQASVFNHEGGPNYRDLYPEPPPPGLVPSCAEAGVLGILPGVIGTIQATETLKLLLGLGSSLSGRLLLYDALQMQFRELTLRRDPSAKPITELIDYDLFCGAPTTSHEPFERVTAATTRARLDAGWRPIWIDVREPHEWEIVRLAHTDHFIPRADLAAHTASLPRDRDILLQCKMGGRSARAAQALAELGFERLFSLEGGIIAWAEEVDPSLPTY